MVAQFTAEQYQRIAARLLDDGIPSGAGGGVRAVGALSR
jgi:hypothetical protein